MMSNAYTDNPYYPNFGTPPLAYIHRYEQENKILNRFCSENNIPSSYMVIGARGMGKTVLMNEMANRFEAFDDWVVARLNVNNDMLRDLLSILSGHKRVDALIKKAKINLHFFELGVETAQPQINNAEAAIVEILKEIKRDEKRLLIVVDEATSTPAMKTFVTAYQNIIGQKLPAYLIMTGIYEKISSLKNEDNLTFLYRMPRILLEPLNVAEIAENYREVFDMEQAAAQRMALHTKGYPFAFQLLGSLAWENDGDYEAVLEEYKADLYEFAYDKIWEETSATDKDIMYSIAVSESGKVSEIRAFAGKEPNEFSPYRDRLKKKGITYSGDRGYVEISLPYFKGYILRRYNGRLLAQAEPDLPKDL